MTDDIKEVSFQTSGLGNGLTVTLQPGEFEPTIAFITTGNAEGSNPRARTLCRPQIQALHTALGRWLDSPSSRRTFDSWAVSIEDVAKWQFHRRDMEPNDLAFDAGHNVSHVAKALGPLAGAAEHRDHGETEGPREVKRAADLIIHAIWLVQALGYDPAQIVKDRIESFGDGFSRVK